MIENLKKIYAILNIEQKKKIGQLSLLIIFSIFFEILSLALIIPLIYVVLDDPYTGIEKIISFFGYSQYSYVNFYFQNINKPVLINLIICIFFFFFFF